MIESIVRVATAFALVSVLFISVGGVDSANADPNCPGTGFTNGNWAYADPTPSAPSGCQAAAANLCSTALAPVWQRYVGAWSSYGGALSNNRCSPAYGFMINNGWYTRQI